MNKEESSRVWRLEEWGLRGLGYVSICPNLSLKRKKLLEEQTSMIWFPSN